jgi:hypothetical protein
MSTLDLFTPEAGAGDDDSVGLAEYAERAYLEYALSVVKGRALPDVADGQKPVQRRILYAMARMGLGFTSGAGPKAVKSARVVGDVLGRFHPHGDQAAYDALVRMAQDFALRYPLIDGQGNFGSRDGDGAAAMRYTEARLAPIARLLLDEIDEGTVDFIPNYDGSTEEPRLLPARLPFVLLNGASGIAVGLATEIPSHNLREVAAAAIALLKNDKLGADELAALLPGPTIPAAARSSARRRDPRRLRDRPRLAQGARALEDRGPRARPVAARRHRAAAGDERAARPRGDRGAHQSEGEGGKKTLAAEQVQLKATVLAVLDKVRDESNKEAAGPHRLRAAEPQHRPERARHDAARAHQPRELDADQPDDGRRRRPADAEEPRPAARRMGSLSPADGRAALAPPARQGRRPDPHPRGPPARAARDRRGDRDHPRRRRAEGGADRALLAERAPGRRHPRHPPAPAGAARGDPDRAGAEGAARRSRRS